jgi:flagellar basal-body rod protein FlgF
MLQGVYAAAAGMITQRERLDVIANNIANVSTTGFKRSEPISRAFYQIFGNEIARFPALRGSREIPGGGSAIDDTREDFAPGPIVETGNPLDIAIRGPGFLVIDTPQGERYTRAGNLTLNSEGQLVTQSGQPIMGQRGSIFAQGESVQISAGGEVLVDGDATDKLLIIDFTEPHRLTKYGQNLYGAIDEMRQTQSILMEPNLIVGALEHSNVNPIAELTLLMDAARSYEAHQRVILALDELLDSTVNDIART